MRTVSACYPKIRLQATLIGSQMPGLQSRKLAELLGLFYKQAAWCQRCDAAPSQSASNGVPRYVCGCNIRRGAAGVQPGLELVAIPENPRRQIWHTLKCSHFLGTLVRSQKMTTLSEFVGAPVGQSKYNPRMASFGNAPVGQSKSRPEVTTIVSPNHHRTRSNSLSYQPAHLAANIPHRAPFATQVCFV